MGMDFHESGTPRVDSETCIGCGQCVKICPSDVLVMEAERPRPSRGSFMGCIACGHCMAVCPTGAMTVRGRGLSPEDAVALNHYKDVKRRLGIPLENTVDLGLVVGYPAVTFQKALRRRLASVVFA